MKKYILCSLIVVGIFSHGQAQTQCQSDKPTEFPVTIECATDIVTQKGYKDFQNVRVYRWPIPVLKGIRIQVSTDAILENEKAFYLEETSYFFFVDLMPGEPWGHPTQFILINAYTGHIEIKEQNGAPLIGIIAPFLNPEDLDSPRYHISGYNYQHPTDPLSFVLREKIGPAKSAISMFAFPTPEKTDNQVPEGLDGRTQQLPYYPYETEAHYLERFKTTFATHQSETQRNSELFKCQAPTCTQSGRKIALVIEGGYLPDTLTKQVETLRDRGWFVYHVAPYLKDSSREKGKNYLTTLPNVARAFVELGHDVQNCCDDVLIYIYGHGDEKGHIMMNPRLSVPDNTAASPNPVVIKPQGEVLGGFLNSTDLKKYLNLIYSCKTKVILHTCYSGFHFQNKLNEIPEEFKGECLCRTVMVTSSARQTTNISGDWLFNRYLENQNNLDNFWKIYIKSTDDIRKIDLRIAVTPLVQSTTCYLCEDSDHDGLTNGQELLFGSDPNKVDTDGDGLSDKEEWDLKTNPNDKDTDHDGLTDGDEVKKYHTNPLLKDSDDDGLDDHFEVLLTTDPLNPDTDGDGFSDGEEVQKGTNPLDKNSHP